MFETAALHLRVHGRTLPPDPRAGADLSSWTGNLETVDNYATTGVLEGASQPPFYPRVEYAEVRFASVERMSATGPTPVEVQYDGHYVLYGLEGDPLPRGYPDPKLDEGRARQNLPGSRRTNQRQIVLDIRGDALNMSMGDKGDRSGAMVRPETHFIAVGVGGPPGGDDFAWWAENPNQLEKSAVVPPPNAGKPPPAGRHQRQDRLPCAVFQRAHAPSKAQGPGEQR